jgi:hypothetical protein
MVQPFAGPNATGDSHWATLTRIYYQAYGNPIATTYLYNADTDVLIQGELHRRHLMYPINVTQTPRVAIVVVGTPFQYRWGAASARITYGNRTVVENHAPLAFPGNAGSNYFGFTPTIGVSHVHVTLYSRQYLKGQNMTYSVELNTVV